jgi:hypothetical protein
MRSGTDARPSRPVDVSARTKVATPRRSWAPTSHLRAARAIASSPADSVPPRIAGAWAVAPLAASIVTPSIVQLTGTVVKPHPRTTIGAQRHHASWREDRASKRAPMRSPARSAYDAPPPGRTDMSVGLQPERGWEWLDSGAAAAHLGVSIPTLRRLVRMRTARRAAGRSRATSKMLATCWRVRACGA